jgi:hypothetical protein
MKKLILFIFIFGCSSPFYPFIQSEEDEEISSVTFELDNEVDENGYVHITSNPNVFQTLYRLKGYVYRDGEPMNVLKFGWYSDTYWTHDGYEIPVVNGSSYSREDGEVNTMMGIIPNMVDDTITVHYGWYDDWKSEEIYGRFDVIIH